MNSLRKTLAEVQNLYPTTAIRYAHPTLYVVAVDHRFHRLDNQQREDLFFAGFGESMGAIKESLRSAGVTLALVTEAEEQEELSFLKGAERFQNWLDLMSPAEDLSFEKRVTIPVVHFYGYKGGQARSTALAMLAKSLAGDGYRVLAVDADVEAPSLDHLFEARVVDIESTLLGVIHFGCVPKPFCAYLPVNGAGNGQVDLIACKPSNNEYDLDLASFALQSSLNPQLVQKRFASLLQSIPQVDAILIDHRSGLGSTVVPIAAVAPGPTVICVRLDEQSNEAGNFFEALFSLHPTEPGIFLSFSLDPEDTRERLLGSRRLQIDDLLLRLSNATALGAENGSEPAEQQDPEDLLSSWLSWFLDRSFLRSGTPAPDQISNDNRATISKMRELLNLSKRQVHETTRASPKQRILTNSGNTDQGLLVQTDALRKLLLPNNPFSYVLGRKGTGKTRLVRALVEQSNAECLLVADDFPDAGFIRSSNPLLKDLVDALSGVHAERLWWVLLDSCRPGEQGRIEDNLRSWVTRIREHGPTAVSISDLADAASSRVEAKTYLIDGVETAFSSGQMGNFVEGLFRFMGAIQSSPRLHKKVDAKLFIRTDLVRTAVENVEQQIDGRVLSLSWETQSILNFALSRLTSLPWFADHFPSTIQKVEQDIERFVEGAVPESECNEYLLELFPLKLRRNNVLTLTFLKDYFSEGQGDTATFYPRIYDYFLRAIADPRELGQQDKGLDQIEDGKVAQALIIAAHDYASKQYLQQVVSELKNLVQLDPSTTQNNLLVQTLIASFQGLPTPFELERTLDIVVQEMGKAATVPKEQVRRALEQMKGIGIFEDRPGRPGWWRAGRLFKNALGMKYVRK